MPADYHSATRKPRCFTNGSKSRSSQPPNSPYQQNLNQSQVADRQRPIHTLESTRINLRKAELAGRPGRDEARDVNHTHWRSTPPAPIRINERCANGE